jgi:hypothetical protein
MQAIRLVGSEGVPLGREEVLAREGPCSRMAPRPSLSDLLRHSTVSFHCHGIILEMENVLRLFDFLVSSDVRPTPGLRLFCLVAREGRVQLYHAFGKSRPTTKGMHGVLDCSLLLLCIWS